MLYSITRKNLTTSQILLHFYVVTWQGKKRLYRYVSCLFEAHTRQESAVGFRRMYISRIESCLKSNFNTKTVVNNSFSLTSLHPYELQLKKLNRIYLGVKLGTVKLKDLFNLREKICVKARNHMGPKN